MEEQELEVEEEVLEQEVPVEQEPPFEEEEEAMGDRTLKDLASHKLDTQQWCIQTNSTFEIKPGLIRELPKFHGMVNEDPNKHLMDFHTIVMAMLPPETNADGAMLKAFPFSLAGNAKEWLYYFPSGSVTAWNGLKKLFLERYFPTSKATQIRKEICGMKQNVGESLYECWERYKRLVASCPHHQFSDAMIIQYFYEGLQTSDRYLLDAVGGGALVNKTVAQAIELIESMAANSQQFYTRGEPIVKLVHEFSDSSSHLDQRMGRINRVMQRMAAVIILDDETEQVNALFPNQRPRSFRIIQPVLPNSNQY